MRRRSRPFSRAKDMGPLPPGHDVGSATFATISVSQSTRAHEVAVKGSPEETEETEKKENKNEYTSPAPAWGTGLW